MDIKARVQEQFGKNAEKYVSSPIHAKGKDLEQMAKISNAGANDRLLDIATGGGHTANLFAPLVKEVTALDLTSEILEAAKTFIEGNGYQNVSFIKGDAENLPFPKESFEAVTCRIAPHHFPDLQAFISESYRVLAQGGTLLIIDNTAPEKQEYDEFYNDIEKRRDHSHFRAWKKSEWLKFLEEAGFKIEQMHVFKKTFSFDSWCSRMQMKMEEKEQLIRKMLESPSHLKKYFGVREQSGKIQEFSGEAVLIKAIK
ncbi:class I SAM-dependent methyltransferase [Fictibacillus terranigra]|uniref:Methyltransferase domain-containing protein n=1 Tax=Fictibacillus terranigra TaxID=3058424 RepID=A0ABT8E2Y9_9BACL|nr:class I SAM-dependent methyltransferase [Fictibacillus sp. CENA-BCM004]MDN4072251.1 methyltransferase domain-containing protein [Fictibacillus sp. CENA-BCM004]